MIQRIEMRCPKCGSNQLSVSGQTSIPGNLPEGALQCSSCLNTFSQSEALLVTVSEETPPASIQTPNITSQDLELLKIYQTKGPLAAVKFHKEVSGKDLKTAKQYIDALVAQHNIKPRLSSTSGSCYIATTCYGSYDALEVLILREFRDHHLARSSPGRIFIQCYYASAPFVKPIVERSPLVQKILIKYILNPVVNSVILWI